MTQLPVVGELASQRLLLVEDDEGDAFLVRELLDESGGTTDLVWVRSLTEARTVFDGSFDCILIDLGLPDASGLEALRGVLDAAESTAVLVLTGLADEDRATAAVAAGAQDYLVKGQVDGPLLTRSIRYAMERKRADAELRRLYAAELRAIENLRLERGLLPTPLVQDGRVEVTTRYRPGREGVLGGDFFDVIESPDGEIHVLIGDVSGHGPDEAALGVALRIAWRTLVFAGVAQDDLLPILDSILIRERRFEEVFATVCMVLVAPDRRQARLYLAGHPAPLLLGSSTVQLPDDLVGPALGMVPDVVWGSRAVDLGEGWRLMLFTDGLVEGRVGQGNERLGVSRLIDLVDASAEREDSSLLVDGVIAAVRELHGGELTDDLAVVMLDYTARLSGA